MIYNEITIKQNNITLRNECIHVLYVYFRNSRGGKFCFECGAKNLILGGTQLFRLHRYYTVFAMILKNGWLISLSRFEDPTLPRDHFPIQYIVQRF